MTTHDRMLKEIADALAALDKATMRYAYRFSSASAEKLMDAVQACGDRVAEVYEKHPWQPVATR